MIFGDRCFWRDTMNYPQVLVVDARILLFLILAVFNVGFLTFFLLLVMIGIFLFLSWQSVRLESALRMVRLLFLGLERPATGRPLRQPCNYIQYGQDGRWCPRQLRNLPAGSGNFLGVILLVVLIFTPVPGHSWLFWQGLAPFHHSEAKTSEILEHSPPADTPFHSPAPINPDWHQNCLLPGIDQPWCQPALFSSPDPLPPLDDHGHHPRPREITWPIRTAPAAATTPSPCLWIVAAGDTLSAIAQSVYGDQTRWPELAAANGIKDPWYIHPDQCLTDLK